MNKLSDFRRIPEAAEYLGVSPNPPRNWQDAGKLSVHRHPVYVRPFDDVANALADVDPVWERLLPRERARIAELLVERVA